MNAQETTVEAREGATTRYAAISLWVAVGSLLAYGILQTVIKASAIFLA